MILYFKQAWNLIKQEKLFSSLYIIGTGLSITVVMVLSIVYYIRIANIYPETNRDRMLIVKNAMEESPNGDISSANLSYHTIETCFLSLHDTEAVSALYDPWKKHFIQPPGSKEQLPATVKYVDTNFWHVFAFRFLQGTPFTEADFQSGIRTAVISESMSKRLFGTVDAVGQYVSLNFMPYRVCGVVKDASFVTETTFAQLWIPYTVNPGHKSSFAEGGTLGNFGVYILASSAGDMEKIRNEALDNVRKLNSTLPDQIELKLFGQPDRHWESTFRLYSNQVLDFTKIGWQHSLIFLILLLIPGISLSAMTDSRMERRLSEMGIRRAFGAPVKTLMGQIFTENFLFTLLGGLAGLIFSYILILISSDWIMNIGQSWSSVPPDGTKVIFTATMLINIPVFLIALGVCLLLNLIAAVIPAWRASHKDIIFSLNAKQ
ncbi:MAG TPA: multidrug ABC transporter substrate-binding protein [Porphyromonadaceae bacterium]|nr:multidrug ABC transporter substrate-binding protein [Porphyromonadaceae bacterium]